MENLKRMKCSDLAAGREVIFIVWSDIYNRKIPEVGTVSSVEPERKKVWVHWLEGYKDRHELISYDDMIAAYDEDGEFMQFEHISGPSVLLEPE